MAAAKTPPAVPEQPAAPVAFADRVAGLQRARSAVEERRSKEQARLERDKQAAHVKAEADLADLQRAHEAELTATNLKIASAFHAAVAPVVAKLLDEPSRAAAAPLVPIVKAADAATQHELGTEFNLDHAILVAAKLALIVKRPEAAGAIAADSSPIVGDHLPLEAAHRVAKALRAENVGAALAAFDELEAVLLQMARGPAGDAAEGRERLAEACRHATHVSGMRALEALNARQKLARDHAAHVGWLDHTAAIRRYRAGEPAPANWAPADERAALSGAVAGFGPLVERGIAAVRGLLGGDSAPTGER